MENTKFEQLNNMLSSKPTNLEDVDEKLNSNTLDFMMSDNAKAAFENKTSKVVEINTEVEVHETSRKRGPKPKEKYDGVQFEPIINSLANCLLNELINKKYTYLNFNSKETELIVEYIKSKIKGE